MAAAEEDAAAGVQTAATARCACGSETMLLQAFLQVVDGRITPEPVEVETLTCPECGREFEPILKDDGTVLRGDFLGYFEDEPE